jgi:hypothetical protein
MLGSIDLVVAIWKKSGLIVIRPSLVTVEWDSTRSINEANQIIIPIVQVELAISTLSNCH